MIENGTRKIFFSVFENKFNQHIHRLKNIITDACRALLLKMNVIVHFEASIELFISEAWQGHRYNDPRYSNIIYGKTGIYPKSWGRITHSIFNFSSDLIKQKRLGVGMDGRLHSTWKHRGPFTNVDQL